MIDKIVKDYKCIIGKQKPQRPKRSVIGRYVAIMRVFSDIGPPMTVRQVFYQLETMKVVVPKTEQAVENTGNTLLDMRRCGLIPYDFVKDYTRETLVPETHKDPLDAFSLLAKSYERSLWQYQPEYVDIWCEKAALTSIFYGITSMYQVPLNIVRGFSSETFIYEMSEVYKRIAKPIRIYYFGDYDPSGEQIVWDVFSKLRMFGVDFEMWKVLVTKESIESLHLPTRPTKRHDKRKAWKGGDESVELDAVPPNILRERIKETITQHIDLERFDEWRAKQGEDERLIRNALADIQNRLSGKADN